MEKNLKIIYVVLVVTSAVLCIYAYILGSKYIGNPQEYVTLQSMSVILTLLSLPIILKLYNKKMMSTGADREDYVDEKHIFYKWNILRMSVTFVVICMNVVTYSFVHTSSPMICALIAWMFLTFFCIPKKIKINEVKKEVEEQSVEDKKGDETMVE